MLCTRCYGTGSYFGQGMMPTDCDCEELARKKAATPTLNQIDKTSDSYKTAIKDIMKLNPKMSKKDAEVIFNKTYDKV